MDAAATNLESVEATPATKQNSDAEENGEGESAAPPPPPPSKKPRFDEEVNRVAEIVLVLSALRRIRGGKPPTELEIELMVEAKSKLVDMCQEFSPKDIVGRDAVGAVIEDLGLNCKLKDQRLGFRAPKLTISEKLSLGKRKMEEGKKSTVAASTTYTSPGHLTPASNVSMGHQWVNNNEMKVSGSAVNASGTHFAKDASAIRPQFKPDVHTQAPVPAGNYYGNAAPWSAQPHPSSSTISFGTPSESKVHVPSSSRVTDPSFRPFMPQTQPGAFPGMKGVTYGQTSAPFGNNHHAEIAKIVHKVLQPRAKQNLLWNPPSREYMSKAMACQMCQGTINEVETLLICDACEKGYHLKCLQANNIKGVPKSEWHCSRCVQLYSGKSFPPKYGRVMRSATTAKMSSSTGEVQSPAEKVVGKINLKVNKEAMPRPETAKPTVVSATDRTVEAEGATAVSQTVKAENAAAVSQTVEAEDAAAISERVEAEDAAPVSQTVEAEDAAAISERVEAEDAAPVSQTVEAEVAAAISERVEAEDASMNQGVDTNDESQGSVGNEVEGDDPSEQVPQSETPTNPPKQENKEDPSKDVTEGSVSASGQDKDLKITVEPSSQEENSASQPDNSPSQPPLQPNTDHSQQENTTPNVEEALQNVTENPEEN
ncbi:PHD finger protein At3g20280 isoform X2 [Raphanus sativus]|uniref:PHD finger protein At3g20280 isoform X2 n=1 Tax=Raphanus sativus TaxID=3726 RepID=A0A6J0PBH0_RAPSA|nr:PHD finger protein At3g20280 isoform X2 [Raphanus sativus]